MNKKCPMCETKNASIGVLGNLIHYLCGACGMWYNSEKKGKKNGY